MILSNKNNRQMENQDRYNDKNIKIDYTKENAETDYLYFPCNCTFVI